MVLGRSDGTDTVNGEGRTRDSASWVDMARAAWAGAGAALQGRGHFTVQRKRPSPVHAIRCRLGGCETRICAADCARRYCRCAWRRCVEVPSFVLRGHGAWAARPEARLVRAGLVHHASVVHVHDLAGSKAARCMPNDGSGVTERTAASPWCLSPVEPCKPDLAYRPC